MADEAPLWRGDPSYQLVLPPTVLKIYLCSTKADFCWERRRLWEDTLPELQLYFLSRGIDIHLIDPQQGLDDDVTCDAHRLNNVIRDVEACSRTNTEPFFVVLLGDKLGPCPLPHSIEAGEFLAIRNEAFESGKDVKLLDTWYKQDEGQSPSTFSLQPIDTVLNHYTNKTPSSGTDHAEDQDAWRQIQAKLLDLLQHSANVCHQQGKNQNREQYFIPGLEKLIRKGLQLCPENCLLVQRELSSDGRGRRASRLSVLKRNKNKQVDGLNQDRLHEVLDQLLSKLSNNSVYKHIVKCKDVQLDPCEHLEHADYLDKIHEDVVQGLKRCIENRLGPASLNNNHVLLDEARSHLHQYQKYRDSHVGDIDGVLNTLCDNLQSCKKQYRTSVILFGVEGCGKTTLLTKVCHRLQTESDSSSVLIYRQAGLTHASMTGHMLLLGICQHIHKILQQPFEIPLDHFALVKRFKALLERMRSDTRGWIIALDDLHKVVSGVDSRTQSEDYKWIGLELPSNVTLLTTLTVVPDQDGLARFEKIVPSDNHLEIHSLTGSSIEWFVDPTNTKAKQRSPSSKNTNLVNIMKACPNPLFCRLLLENARQRGPEVPLSADVLGNSLESAVSFRLDSLEDSCGQVTTKATLMYLTSTPTGLTELELLDVLSCNNDVMAHVIDVSCEDQIRFPYTLWLRMKRELGCLLEERYLDQKLVTCLSRHNLVQRHVTRRYSVETPDEKSVHADLADLYLETWISGRPLVIPQYNLQLLDDMGRFTAQQPLLYGDTQYNLRRVQQLWLHLLHSGRLDLLKEHCFCKFEYLLAFLHGTSLTSLMRTLDYVTERVLDGDVTIIHVIMQQCQPILSQDRLQLAGELIGCLQNIKSQYTVYLEPLVQQAMDWCDSFHLPILVPLSSWLPDPRHQMVTKVTVPRNVSRLCASASGQHVFCSTGCDIRLYHVASNTHIKTFTGHTTHVVCLLAGHVSSYLFSAATDGTVHVWNVGTARIRHMIKDHTDAVMSMTLSKTDDTLVTGSRDRSIKIMHVHTGDVRQTITKHLGPVTCVLLNKRNTLLASGSSDRTINLWDFEDLVLLYTVDEDIRSPVTCLAMSEDNSFLIFGCEDNCVHVTSLTTGTVGHQLEGHKGKVGGVAISADCVHCVVSCTSGHVYTYNLCSTELLHTFSEDAPISDMILSADDQFIFTAAQESVSVWTFYKHMTKVAPVTQNSHTKPITCYCLSAEGKMAITGSKDGMVKMWNLEISDFIGNLEGHTGAITSLATATQEAFAVSGAMDKTVKVWSIMMSCVITDYKDHSSAVSHIRVLHDNQRILTADGDHVVNLWQAVDGVTLMTLRGPTHILGLTPNTEIGVSGAKDESCLRVWSVETGTVLETISHTDRITCLVFSIDSEYLATGSTDLSLKVWEAKTGKLTQVLVEHEASVSCAAITSDNSHVVSGSHDKRLLVWNLCTGTVQHHMTGHTDHVTSVKVTQDNSVAISGSRDGTLRVWSLELGTVITIFNMHVAVLDLAMSGDASKIVIYLENSRYLPLLCLHNSPASQSQSDKNINLSPADCPLLPIRPRALILHRQITTYVLPRKNIQLDRLQSESTVPEIIRVSPSVAPLQSSLKAKAKKRCEALTTKDKKESNVDKKQKKSSICSIL